MIETILSAIWFFLPAGLANMTPTLVRRWVFLDVPIDLGLRYRGRLIIGPHKTYRGLLSGICAAVLTVYIQRSFPAMSEYSPVDHLRSDIWLLGLALGVGALGGDLLKSFIKRQRGILPSVPWPPFDQLDWIIGALFLSSFYVSLSWPTSAAIVVVFGILHPVVNLLGYYLHLKPNKF